VNDPFGGIAAVAGERKGETMSITEINPVATPIWLVGMEFCHVMPEKGNIAFCGEACGPETPPCPIPYDGEALCPSCGCPTCPRCAQLEALDNDAIRKE
jgi:hypothetical protein